MGSNQNRFGDKKAGAGHEWGSKGRKEANAARHAQLNDFAIEDQLHPKPTPGGKRRRKDTKRWCRGKEGREHDFQPFKKWEFFGRAFVTKKCTVCGKEKWER